MSPPTLADLRLEPEIVAAAYPNRGMVLLAGPTGSGKTSTTASLIRNIVEGNADIAGNLLLFENPIEFLYSEIPSSCCTVAQHEIPTHLPSFEEAIADSLRRHPALIQIQELRYISEISAATRAANTGLPVYASVHANSAAHVIARLVEEFPDSQRDAAFSNILETTQLIVAQVLVRRRDGKGMVCLREWIDIDNRTRARLHRAGRVSCTDVVRQILNEGEAAQSMERTVARHFAAGEIDAHTAARVLSGFGYDEGARQMRSGAATERQSTTSRELEAAY